MNFFGEKFTSTDKDHAAFLEAVRISDLHDVAKYLSEYDETIIHARNKEQKTALHINLVSRSEFQKDEIFDLLMQHAPDLNAVNDIGDTPLHYAAMMLNEKACATLLKAGADIGIENCIDHTAVSNLRARIKTAGPMDSRHELYARVLAVLQPYEERMLAEKATTRGHEAVADVRRGIEAPIVVPEMPLRFRTKGNRP